MIKERDGATTLDVVKVFRCVDENGGLVFGGSPPGERGGGGRHGKKKAFYIWDNCKIAFLFMAGCLEKNEGKKRLRLWLFHCIVVLYSFPPSVQEGGNHTSSTFKEIGTKSPILLPFIFLTQDCWDHVTDIHWRDLHSSMTLASSQSPASIHL